MKKIGIITFWQSNDNYGQLLQCWALQQYLMKLGHSPFLIRYNYDFQKEEAPLWKRVAKLILIWPYLKQKRAESIRKKNWKRNEIRQFDNFRQVETLFIYYQSMSGA